MTEIVVIENESWRVGLIPSTGGSVAFGQTRIGDAWVDVLRPTPTEHLRSAPATASYPLVPWSNRIHHGALAWQGREYQLRINFPDGTAIHGTGSEFPWTVVEKAADRVVLEFVSTEFYGVNFPWSFTARFTYALDGNRFTWGMAVTNTDAEAFPAGLGHHPHFLRALTGADGNALGGEVQLQVNSEMTYPLEACMPVGPAATPPPHTDFRTLRPLGDPFVDDCFTGRTSPVTATLEYPGALTVDFEADDLFQHVVVYIPQGQTFLAVEPVTNANDGFNLMRDGVEGHGVFVVEPGATVGAEFSLVANVH